MCHLLRSPKEESLSIHQNMGTYYSTTGGSTTMESEDEKDMSYWENLKPKCPEPEALAFGMKRKNEKYHFV